MAGKGGTGKSTFCALLISELLKQGKKPILAVDADPNSNLNELLGIKYEHTVADIREDLRADKVPSGFTKSEYVNYQLEQSIVEGNGLDLLIMGQPEGRGCYCYVNELLRDYLAKISKKYSCVVMDNEAGMEHLSRRTTDDIDHLFIVSQPTVVSLQAAQRIKELTKSIKLKIKNTYLVLNQATEEKYKNTVDRIQNTGLDIIGIIPDDRQIEQLAEQGGKLLDLTDKDSVAVDAVKKILHKLNIFQ